jgi:putative ABC transport system ATP-binding protein
VLDLLGRLHAGGLTLLVVTHDPQVARRAERALVMADGRLVRRLTRQELGQAGAPWGAAAGS